jgi:hypothetical protein
LARRGYGGQEIVYIERLGDDLHGKLGQKANERYAHREAGGAQKDETVAFCQFAILCHFAQELGAVQAGHELVEYDHHASLFIGMQDRQRIFPFSSLEYRIAGILKYLAQGLAQGIVALDDEDSLAGMVFG